MFGMWIQRDEATDPGMDFQNGIRIRPNSIHYGTTRYVKERHNTLRDNTVSIVKEWNDTVPLAALGDAKTARSFPTG